MSIDQLKQAILQLAVMGKLVPQDPNDEPAAKLLERIAAEKAQLVKEGKIKKQKPLPPIAEDDKPFELPNGWEWCRLGALINLISGQHLKPSEFSERESIAIPGISREDVEDAVIAISPLNEQHRIVTKVNQLTTLCDQIKTQLQHQQQTRLHLADAMVDQVLNPTAPNSPTQPKAANP